VNPIYNLDIGFNTIEYPNCNFKERQGPGLFYTKMMVKRYAITQHNIIYTIF